MNTFIKATLAAALALGMGGFVRAADVTGKWKSEFDTQIGHQNYTYELKADGEKVTGKAIRTLDGQKTETDIKEGKVTGDEISFVEPLTVQDQDIRIEYKGKISGDEIKLTRKVGDFATTEIVAKREKAAAVSIAGKWQSEFDTQVGHFKYVFELKADGEKVTGTANRDRDGEKLTTELKEGKLSGGDVSFVEPVTIQEQEVRIEYKGKVSGDEMKLTRKVGDFGTADIVAKRVK